MESLSPDRSLLNYKFEGYKLSGDTLDVCSTALLSAVNDLRLKDELLISFQHMRAFGNINHLVLDSWIDGGKTEAVYFMDENNELQKASVKEKEISCLETVFKIPSTERKREHVNATLFFPSPSLACLSDGSSKLFLLCTGDRTKDTMQSDQWKVMSVYQFDQPSLILHAIENPKNDGSISCLLLSISENETSTSVKDAHIVHLELITFSKVKNSSGIDCFSCDVIQHFKGYSTPVYAAIEPSCTALLVASDKPFSLAKGDKELSSSFQGNYAEKQETRNEAPSSLSIPVYKWSQDSEDITVKFQIPDGTSKADITCEIKADSLNVCVGQNVLLSGELFAKVNSKESTWTCDGNSVEVVLMKQTQEHHWSSVVRGDERGTYELVGEDAERVKEIHNRLEHLTSDKPVGDPRGNSVSFSDQQFEECDALPEDIKYIFRLDIETGEVTHKVCLATHQWIFNAILNQSLPPAFCIRHDVDALLWQPKAQPNSEANWKHVGTFNALGYVQAAKRDRKFSTCAPNMSFATLCDCTRHVYVYQQPEKGVEHASQYVVTIGESENEILGLQASNDRVFVLTKQSLHVVNMK